MRALRWLLIIVAGAATFYAGIKGCIELGGVVHQLFHP